MSRWPVWRTAPLPFVRVGWRPIVLGALAVVLVPVSLSLVIFLPAAQLFDMVGAPTGALGALAFLGAALLYSPVLTIPTLAVAAPLSIWLMRRGRAGWGVALVAGAASGSVAGLILHGPHAAPVLAGHMVLGGLLGGLYWFVAVRTSPEAFLPPK